MRGIGWRSRGFHAIAKRFSRLCERGEATQRGATLDDGALPWVTSLRS